MDERRNLERKDFSYYMRLINNDTGNLLGHLVDISSGGFKLDSQEPVPVNKDFRLRMDLTSEVADKPAMVFVARSKWCEVDPLDPFIYNVGFELINISPADLEIIRRMMEKYGKKIKDKRVDKRRTNLW
jgi:hypothetical protein